jgi:DNA primase
MATTLATVRMNILQLLPNLKRIASTRGGEWAGPCPHCGGQDRFRVWPERGNTGRFWCRSCGWSGDGLQMLRDLKGLTFPEALKAWGLTSTRSSGTVGKADVWEPKAAKMPEATWGDRAKVFLDRCQGDLWRSSGAAGRTFLFDRGLKSESIKSAGLGWNASDLYQSRGTWGLNPEQKRDDRAGKIWLPKGLVIPGFDQARIIRLKIRRSYTTEGKYIFIPGSSSVPMAWGCKRKTIILVESELDGLLIAQEAGDLVGVIALGSAQIRPDMKTDKALREVGLILVALDSDRAGKNESWGFWKKNYPNARRWPVPIGKDPTEAAQGGLNIRAWIIAGMH